MVWRVGNDSVVFVTGVSCVTTSFGVQFLTSFDERRNP
nr:MAG TPA: hypothetical protein [Caudoviricetes sp.]